MSVMRSLLLAALALCLIAPVARAAPDPGELVLRVSDVPGGFVLDHEESGVRTNELEAKEFPETKPLFRRWGRVTGYQVLYRRDSSRIEDRVDVFRTAAGARELLEFVDLEYRKAGLKGQRRTPVDIGAGGSMHYVGGSYALVIWRQGSIFAGCFGEGIPRARVLALARVQERRIALARR